MDFLCSKFRQKDDNIVTVKKDVACTTTVSNIHFFQVSVKVWKSYNSSEPLSDNIINPSDQVVNANSYESSNLYNMTNEVPPQDSNDANNNK